MNMMTIVIIFDTIAHAIILVALKLRTFLKARVFRVMRNRINFEEI